MSGKVSTSPSNDRITRLLSQLTVANTTATAPPKIVYTRHPSNFPTASRTYWAKDPNEIIDSNVYPMDVSSIFSKKNKDFDIMQQHIDLWLETNEKNRFHHAVKEDSSHWQVLGKMKGIGYGIDFDDFYKLTSHWKRCFDLNQHLAKLNAFNHFQANIQGLNIHFIRESTNPTPSNSEASAIIVLHGWPGSFWEFHKIINPLKTALKQTQNEFTDIIIPSLPGFAFSEYPMHCSDFNIIAVASIFKELMARVLGYKHYIISAGDWGAHIAKVWGYQACKETDDQRKLSGILLNDTFCSGHDLNEESVIDLKKYSRAIYRLLNFSGYQHIQNERPNTIGLALEASPVAVLAWIYEMYLLGTDGPMNVDKMKYDDSGNRIIGGELCWNDVIFTAMLYWLNGRVTTNSMYYADNLKLAYTELRYYYMPKSIKIGIVDWPNSMGNKKYLRYHFRNIVYFNKEKKGGHFAGLEMPTQYVQNVVNFIKILLKT